MHPLEPALASTPPPATQCGGISLLSGPQPREGRNQHGSPKKVSERETRPSHGGSSGSSPAANHRPPCLFPSPRATSVCVCVPTTRVTQTRRPDPRLTHCWSWPEEPHNSVTKTLPFSWDYVASRRPPLQILFWGISGFGPQPPGQPLPHVLNGSPRQRYPVRQAELEGHMNKQTQRWRHSQRNTEKPAHVLAQA